MKVIAISIAALGMLLVAQDKEKHKPRDMKDRTWTEGKLVCIGCHLQNQKGGAKSECTLHAKHAQGFLKADGTLWSFVDNTRGHHLIVTKDLRDEPIKIYGWSWPKAHYMEVYKYQIKYKGKWEIWDWCKI